MSEGNPQTIDPSVLSRAIQDTGGQMDATTRGVNPYAPGRMPAVAAASGDSSNPYRPDAKGLDGDLLDAMIKGRWEEGREVGYGEGHRAAAQSFQGIYDDGFRAGHTTGFREADLALSAELLPALETSAQTLITIAEKTGSQAIKDVANAMIARIKPVLDSHVGRHGSAETPPQQ